MLDDELDKDEPDENLEAKLEAISEEERPADKLDLIDSLTPLALVIEMLSFDDSLIDTLSLMSMDSLICKELLMSEMLDKLSVKEVATLVSSDTIPVKLPANSATVVVTPLTDSVSDETIPTAKSNVPDKDPTTSLTTPVSSPTVLVAVLRVTVTVSMTSKTTPMVVVNTVVKVATVSTTASIASSTVARTS